MLSQVSDAWSRAVEALRPPPQIALRVAAEDGHVGHVGTMGHFDGVVNCLD
jgi:hypothetical protein